MRKPKYPTSRRPISPNLEVLERRDLLASDFAAICGNEYVDRYPFADVVQADVAQFSLWQPKGSCQFCEWPKRPIVLLILT
jgi:hypothetical protein